MIQIGNSAVAGELGITNDRRALVETDLKKDVDSAINSTTANLAANAQFSGVWEDATAYKSISIFQLSNVASATGGLKLQFSNDNSTVDFSWDINTTAAVPKYYSLPIMGKYFRVIYVNGATLQTSFRINTRLSSLIADMKTRVADFTIVATAAVNTIVTATLPAAGVGTYHYISSVTIQKFATALLTAGAAPIIATTTNLNSWSCNTDAAALAQGTLVNSYQEYFVYAVKSQNANTASSISVPATAGAIYKIAVTYFIGA